MEDHKFPEFVKDWIAKIESSVSSDSKTLTKYCEKLELHAEEVQSDYLMGYSLFYRGFHCYNLAKLEDSMHYFSAALGCLIAGEAWDMAARAYNAMGTVADFQGDISYAIDCYVSGLALCVDHAPLAVEYKLWSNLGTIYISLDKPSNAVHCLLQCQRLAENGFAAAPRSRFLVCCNLIICHTRLGELEKAKTYLAELRELLPEPLSTVDQLSVDMLETELYHRTDEFDLRDKAIDRLYALRLSDTDIFDELSEICRHAELLLEIGKTEQFLALVTRMEQMEHAPAVQKSIIELHLKYYELIGDQENYAKSAIAFYAASQQREEERNKIISHSIMARIHLVEESVRRKEVERYNLMLKQQAETDMLTGLYNRGKLNEIAEGALLRSAEGNYPIVVEILDIDYFKELNDHYGHKAGDECLIAIADIFRQLEGLGNISVARFGGDEFVILYENYSREEVEQIAIHLQQQIHDLNMVHAYSPISDRVTISQGLFHRIPLPENRLWDFLHGADIALYGVKNHGKNGYFIASTYDEARSYNPEDQQLGTK